MNHWFNFRCICSRQICGIPLQFFTDLPLRNSCIAPDFWFVLVLLPINFYGWKIATLTVSISHLHWRRSNLKMQFWPWWFNGQRMIQLQRPEQLSFSNIAVSSLLNWISWRIEKIRFRVTVLTFSINGSFINLSVQVMHLRRIFTTSIATRTALIPNPRSILLTASNGLLKICGVKFDRTGHLLMTFLSSHNPSA